MGIWEELGKVNVKNADKYAKIFAMIVHKASTGMYNFHITMKEYDDYVIICEENRGNSYFIHVVPKEIMPLFRKMQIEYSNQFRGFSVLCGNKNNLSLRVSCFGVSQELLSKAMSEYGK